jgi:hypothetical protein
MSIVAFVGEGSTTTALAGAICWPNRDAVLVEMDPSGGCLSAWLDVPRAPGLRDLVSRIGTANDDAAQIAASAQVSAAGPRVVVSPLRAVESAAVVHAAGRSLLPALEAATQPFFVDAGRMRGVLSPAVRHASLVVVCHRQFPGSSPAAAAALEHVAESVGVIRTLDVATVVALIGNRPYPADEVESFVDAPVVALPVDPWSAAVLAGRPGSAHRLQRSPLLVGARRLTSAIVAMTVKVDVPVGAGVGAS